MFGGGYPAPAAATAPPAGYAAAPPRPQPHGVPGHAAAASPHAAAPQVAAPHAQPQAFNISRRSYGSAPPPGQLLQGMATPGSGPPPGGEGKEAPQPRHVSREPPKLQQQPSRAGEAPIMSTQLHRGTGLIGATQVVTAPAAPGPANPPVVPQMAAPLMRVPLQQPAPAPHRPDPQLRALEDLQREMEELRRQNADLAQRSELLEAGEVSRRSAEAEAEELAQRFGASEEELSRERTRSRRLSSELEEAHAQAAAAGSAEAREMWGQLEELRRYVAERERDVLSLRGCVERLEQAAAAGAEAAEEARSRDRFSGDTPNSWDGQRADQLFEELEQLKAELEERTRGGWEVDSSGNAGAVDSLEGVEVRLLRAKLAKRDRELLAAAAARRRTADQSERAAAALRAKLTELEAAVAATPSTSSRASTPRSSERGGPSDVPGVDRAVQTEFEVLAGAVQLQAGAGQPAGARPLGPEGPVWRPQPLGGPVEERDAWDVERLQAAAAELLRRQGASACGRLPPPAAA